MTKKQLTTLWALAAALLPTQAAGEVQMQVERVALFKNGYACVQMVGKMEEGLRQSIKGMPMPVLGTLWWRADVDTLRLDAEERAVSQPAACANELDLLLANVGKVAELKLGESATAYRGRIVLPGTPGAASGAGFVSPLLQVRSSEEKENKPELFSLQMDDGGCISFTTESISSLSIPSDQHPQIPENKVNVREFSVVLREPAPGAQLRLGCLSYGLSWLPIYSVELQGDDHAKVTCRAMIMNDLVDMKDVRLDLVTGFPALGSSLVPSPLSITQDLKKFLESLDSSVQLEDSHASGVMTNSAMNLAYHTESVSAAMGELSGQLSRAEDLFYYTLPAFSCNRGETVVCDLMERTVPCKHVYTCTVGNQDELVSRSRRRDALAEVWHAVRLSNTGDMPWSAGTASCYAADRLIARSMLHTTIPGQMSLLQLNKTFDASVSCSEALVKDASEKKYPSEANVCEVYRGVVEFKNESDREMEVELTKDISGMVTQASDGGQITVTPTYRKNPRSLILWKCTVPPGKSKSFSYQYSYED